MPDKVFDCLNIQKIKFCENEKAHLSLGDCENDADFESIYQAERKLQEEATDASKSKLFYAEIEMIYQVVLHRLYALRRKNSDETLNRKIISIIKAIPKSLTEYKFAINLENLSLVEPHVSEDLAPDISDHLSEQIVEPSPHKSPVREKKEIQ